MSHTEYISRAQDALTEISVKCQNSFTTVNLRSLIRKVPFISNLANVKKENCSKLPQNQS